jgi:mono/diheme cytochrome c family protein
MTQATKKTVSCIIFGICLATAPILPAQTQQPKHPAGSSSLKASIAAGETVYKAQCLTCHQVDGGGVSNMNPPLIKTKWVLGDKQTLITIVIKGLKTPIQIDGDDYHNVMPPHPTMTDQEIADVLTYVRNSFGNKASAVKPAEVAAARKQIK